MRWLPAVVVLAFAAAGTAPAVACSSNDNVMVFFDFRSAELSANGRRSLELAASAVKGKSEPTVPAACRKQVVVTGYADTAEASTPDVRIDLARAESTWRGFERLGVDIGAVRLEGRMNELLVPTGPGVREPQNRRAMLQWTTPKGHWRCDPATEQQADSAACIGKYRACYYELTDGTICNFNGVPDPGPQRYSVYDP